MKHGKMCPNNNFIINICLTILNLSNFYCICSQIKRMLASQDIENKMPSVEKVHGHFLVQIKEFF